MDRTLSAFAVVLTLITGCAERTPAAVAAAPLYPYWPLARLPGGTVAPDQSPPPTAAAVLVAKGYLLTTTSGMGEVADDFRLDPTVYVYDGAAWHQGRYVDRDKRTRLALIRADVPGTPVRIARAERGSLRLVGLRPFAAAISDEAAVPGTRCDEFPPWALEQFGERAKPSLCFKATVHDLAGGMFLDAEGDLAGIQVNPLGVVETAGPNADDIRAFLDLYFSTWGSSVKPKPKY